MFTGIVWGTAPISHISDKSGLRTIAISLPPDFVATAAPGQSVALDGVCLTVVRKTNTELYFDIIDETLKVTSLGSLTLGSPVNYEPSLKFGDQIGGHILSGHVDGRAQIINIKTPPNNVIVTLKIPEPFMKYILRKGYIALNGASLTVVEVRPNDSCFTVHLIPETLRLTTFRSVQVGDQINFEIDRQTQTIVDTITLLLPELRNRN